MAPRPAALLAAAAIALGVSGCGTGTETTPGQTAATESVGGAGSTTETAVAAEALDTSGDETLPAEVAELLEPYGISGQDGIREAVAALDVLPEQRPLDVRASVRTDEVVFGTEDGEEVAVPIPGEHVYVSIAPYVEHTHDCHFHALGGCQGELVEEDISVTITDHTGQTLVEEETTTYVNGFVGYWLPQDAHGMITITQGERSGQSAFETGDGDATCITTLQLG